MKKFLKTNWPLFFVLLCCYWAIKPLLFSGFFSMHDDTQVARIGQMFIALSQGQFPVRIVGDLGYGFGYLIFNFYAPLAYYIGAFFFLFSPSFLVATKLTFAFSFLVGAITSFLLGKEIWGRWGGVLTALFYTFAPYHAVDLYVRGALSELWALALAPLIYLGLIKIFKVKKISFSAIIIFVAGFAGVTLSHNLSVLINLPFILIASLIMICFKKEKLVFLKNLSLGLVFSLGLSAFYFLPAITEMKLTNVFGQVGGGADFADHFVFVDQLWASPWGFGGSAPGRLDGISFMVGKIHLILAGFVLIAFLIRLLKRKKDYLLPVGLLAGGLSLSLFLTLPCSLLFWQILSPMAFIQYPWRFLGISILFVSLLVGSLPILLGKKEILKAVAVISLAIVLISFSVKYFKTQDIINKTDDDYLSQQNIKWNISKISDEYLPKDFPVPKTEQEVVWQKTEVLQGEVYIEEIENLFNRQKFLFNSDKESQILINTAHFPGWQLKVNGREVSPIIYKGKIKVDLGVGENLVELELKDTLARSIGNLVSLVSLFTLLFLAFKVNRKNA